MPPEEQTAADLLKQYHRDLQVPYQQRDEARADAENWHNIATEALKQRDDVKEASVLLGAEMVKYLRAAEEARDAYRKIAVARGEKLVKIAGLL
jgi:uncharacterized coiled-coil DUF342 family protein